MKTYLPLLFLFYSIVTNAQVSVLTQHNDLARTGDNLHETILNTTNVNQWLFGKIFTRAVDDQVYAQPLVVSNVVIPSAGKKNVVYVATVNNTLYAYDADDKIASAPYWADSLTPKGAAVMSKYDLTGACNGDYTDFSNHIGIVSTPVIDTNTHTIFVLTRDRVLSDTSYEQWLHAIDIRDGSEKSYSPIRITAKYFGDGDGNVNDTLYFDAQKQNQRAALTLVNGIVYIAWAGHCDWSPYYGWVIGYDTTLKQKYIWMDTPGGSNGGIWMSGEGISSDGLGNLYLSTGAGTSYDSTGNPVDTVNLGDSYLKLTPSGDSLKLATFFIPHDYKYLYAHDLDMGTAGLLLIPNTNWALSGCKQGIMYLVNRDTMGRLDSINHVIESFNPGGNLHGIFGSPVYWKNDTAEYVYVWPSESDMYAFKVDRLLKQIDSTNGMKTVETAPKVFIGGGMLSISADSTAIGTGIVWTSTQLNDSKDSGTYAGILRAYDAGNLKSMLWTSEQNPDRDSIGRWAKFAYPTIANGKVYVPTFSDQLLVYGLLNPAGLFEPQQTNIVSFYPDPAKDIVYFTAQHSITRIEIDDMLGRTIKTANIDLQQSFDVSSLSQGMYLVKFFNANSITVKKLVVAR